MNQEIPDTACLVDVDLDKVASFASTELATASSIFSDKRLLDHKVRLGQDTQLLAQCLLFGREQVQRRAVGEVEWSGC